MGSQDRSRGSSESKGRLNDVEYPPVCLASTGGASFLPCVSASEERFGQLLLSVQETGRPLHTLPQLSALYERASSVSTVGFAASHEVSKRAISSRSSTLLT
jgi:hypothetical protein